VLAAYGEWDGNAYPLKAVFAGMVGDTHNGTTILPGTAYRLTVDGNLEVA
jgi:hypothetical protein